jgi:hypothetical protein
VQSVDIFIASTSIALSSKETSYVVIKYFPKLNIKILFWKFQNMVQLLQLLIAVVNESEE